jgi:erythromycin esterase-like protein
VADANQALAGFRRFPMWMWRNSAFLEFVEWLWVHNGRESTLNRAAVYGMDLYSLYSSLKAVIEFLDRVTPVAAEHARTLYSCFDHTHQDPVRYGRLVRIGARRSCEKAATEIAEKLFSAQLVSNTIDVDPDDLFFAKQNAELVKNAEKYYRNLFSPLANTWNVRDTHMADTVDRTLAHLQVQGRPGKIVIWAHNSHIGDDRGTEMGWHGQTNIGQLLRERHPRETFHVGFTTYEGTVTAAERWDAPPSVVKVRPALPGSYEALFHQTGIANFLLDLKNPKVARALMEPRLERAIGVVYSPTTERASHYFLARIIEQFDAILHFDSSRAVEPIDRLATPSLDRPSELQI